jgi:hypothetical protein
MDSYKYLHTQVVERRRRDIMRHGTPGQWRQNLNVALLLLLLAAAAGIFYAGRNPHATRPQGHHAVGSDSSVSTRAASSAATSYVYYTLKAASGFVLARAPKGTSGQPLGEPRPVAQFGNGFGLAESDSVLSMQLSPDGRYLAIDGTQDHGEQVWVFDTQRMTLNLNPRYVMGNFLHWIPGAHSHMFLYRPMLPLGPDAPLDGGSWNPGLWIVDAATGVHRNIDIHMPSAYLVDAAASPDGSHILYSTSSGMAMGSDTWMMRSDGGQVTHLFHIPAGAQSIAGFFTWSPDGKTIAYELLSDSPTPFLPAGLWIMNSSSGARRYLAEIDGGHGFAPVWSPDSRAIAYVQRTNYGSRQADLSAQSLQSAIAVVDVGTGRSWIVAAPAQTGMQINANPQWSANGARITFTAFNPLNRVIGGTPRYWSASVAVYGSRPSVTPLSPAIPHVVAMA